ncbi:glutathione S-transferase [Pseudovirgaria hyperparasitica]|uniref:Glutathione S-transferase n=1 Tax=Pseudovirgaria hyperparasitica TaxID=470096 RepID=A0A6A6WLH2_9PEZI|nr:glutathione S-transferase [Pseudovirgaria hyperparasitica]KAF2763047.1 glutathione S-transferase [Pseudovirgaria hyperparasitica]
MASNFYLEDTPAEVKNAKGLHLITSNTPNGKKVQIMLEELKELYGTEYTTTIIDLSTNEQKKDWFLKLNPNGRIPVLIDNTQNPPFPVMETSAELLYLFKEEDKKAAFGYTDDYGRSECLQWLFFWHGSGQPIQGQLGWFSRNAKDNEVAINRFKNEVLRIYGVLELHLSGKYTGQAKEYLAGKGAGKYSVADISTWPWLDSWHKMDQITQEDMDNFPHLQKWIERIGQRPAVKRGTDPKTWAI